MRFQTKLIVRLNVCAPDLRRRTLEKRWSLCAAAQPQRALLTTAGPHAYASCRYASDTAYSRAFTAARDNPEKFWGEKGHDVDWFEPWSKTLHVADPVFPSW